MVSFFFLLTSRRRRLPPRGEDDDDCTFPQCCGTITGLPSAAVLGHLELSHKCSVCKYWYISSRQLYQHLNERICSEDCAVQDYDDVKALLDACYHVTSTNNFRADSLSSGEHANATGQEYTNSIRFMPRLDMSISSSKPSQASSTINEHCGPQGYPKITFENQLSTTYKQAGKDEEERPRFLCPLGKCEKTFSRSYDAQRHTTSHGPKAVRCPKGCGRAFFRRDALSSHCLDVHNMVKCDIGKCGAWFKSHDVDSHYWRRTQSALLARKQHHLDDHNMLACSGRSCNKVFRNPEGLEKHENSCYRLKLSRILSQ